MYKLKFTLPNSLKVITKRFKSWQGRSVYIALLPTGTRIAAVMDRGAP